LKLTLSKLVFALNDGHRNFWPTGAPGQKRAFQISAQISRPIPHLVSIYLPICFQTLARPLCGLPVSFIPVKKQIEFSSIMAKP
jgi:hypothetical protein